MPRFTHSHVDDSQVDPFNAADPVMPGGEPEWLVDEPEDAGYAPHGEVGGEPHKDADNYQAPTTRGHDYDAPSIDEEPESPTTGSWMRSLGQQWQQAMSEAQGEKNRAPRPRRAPAPRGGSADPRREGVASGLRLVVIAFIIVTVIANVVPTVVSCVGEIADGALSFEWGDESGYDYEDVYEDYGTLLGDDEGERAAEAMGARLEVLLADPAGGELHERLVSYLDERLLESLGRTSAELGIDGGAWATWFISNVSCGDIEAYAYEKGIAHAYFDIQTPLASSVLWETIDPISSYLAERGLTDPAIELGADDQRLVSSIFQEELEGAQPLDRYCSADLALVDGEWRLEGESLDEFFTDTFGMY